jgi:hypothetical protein
VEAYPIKAEPNVEGLDRDDLFRAGRLYMERYYLGPGWERLHHIVESDPEVMHNHPWDFFSVLLTGGYRETTDKGEQEFYAPCVIRRDARDFHRLTLLDGPMWTFVTTGPVTNTWGFLTEDGFVKHTNYLR